MDAQPPRQLEIQLEGSPKNGGAVDVDDLYKFLQHLTKTLSAVEREITGDPRAHTAYKIVRLSYSSPLTMVLEGVPIPIKKRKKEPEIKDLSPAVVTKVRRIVEQVSHDEDPEDIGSSTLALMEDLAAGQYRHISAVRLASAGQSTVIPPDFDAKIRRMLGNVNRSEGSFKGKLEAVNLHAKTSTVNIYPVIGPARVRGTFRKGQFPNIGEMLNRTVELHGVLKFRGDSPHPYEIDIREIVPIPAGAVATAEEIIGSMPGITGGLDPDEYLRKLRDEEAA
jgi:hypothetical protein